MVCWAYWAPRQQVVRYSHFILPSSWPLLNKDRAAGATAAPAQYNYGNWSGSYLAIGPTELMTENIPVSPVTSIALPNDLHH